MTDESPDYSGGWKFAEGRDADLKLAARIFRDKVVEAGGDVEAELIFSLLLKIRNQIAPDGRIKLAGSEAGGFDLFFRSSDGEEQFGVLTAVTAGGWRVSLGVLRDTEGVQIVTSVGALEEEPQSSFLGDYLNEAQDLPQGGAAQTLILMEKGGAGVGPLLMDLAFVAAEIHFSHGTKWNPSPERMAEVGYYPDGVVKWQRSWIQGRVRAVGDHPSFRSFWENGNPQVVEYGGQWGGMGGGKDRARSKGPAYEEFYRNGNKALSMFAENGEQIGPMIFFGTGGKIRKPKKEELEIARREIQAEKLTSPMDWMPHSPFLARHASCWRKSPEVLGEGRKTDSPSMARSEEETSDVLSRPRLLSRVFDKVLDAIVPR